MKNKRLLSILILVSSISCLLILIMIVLWGIFFYQSKQESNGSVSGVNLNKRNNYEKVATFEVPILMYHYIRNAPDNDPVGEGLSVSPDNFDEQVSWLSENGYASVNLSDLADTERIALSRVYGQGKKPIVLTFDDGYLDVYTQALPVLKKYDFTATFFIITNFVGRSGYMNDNQINELKKAGMEIGSHTLNHPDMTNIKTSTAEYQLEESKGESIVFCYPAGKYNNEVAELVKSTGYVAAVTTKSGVATQDSDLYTLPRVRIENGAGDYLAARLNATRIQKQ